MNRGFLSSILATMILSLAGCGYALVGKGSVLPDHIQSVAINAFENRTTRPEIEQRVTEEVAREFSQRGRYRIVSDPKKADAVLDGAIQSLSTRPVQFSSAGRATRVETVVTLQATLRETATDEILWSQSRLMFRQQYDVQEEGEFFDESTLALDDIARGAAGTLVSSILEGF
ncbi:MAG: LptE family protein [Acidobacteria bacterium]|uniref:LptE family protein n=1 Tax=Candidatus Polarisedimenticola svalbardensis TaxID=2886004 RepID=A0A8J6Y6I4_9BACT|nr:LptE family protein [Candidatus Polarisedimenticola svalbardensis]